MLAALTLAIVGTFIAGALLEAAGRRAGGR